MKRVGWSKILFQVNHVQEKYVLNDLITVVLILFLYM